MPDHPRSERSAPASPLPPIADQGQERSEGHFCGPLPWLALTLDCSGCGRTFRNVWTSPGSGAWACPACGNHAGLTVTTPQRGAGVMDGTSRGGKPVDKWSFFFPDPDELTNWRRNVDYVFGTGRLVAFILGQFGPNNFGTWWWDHWSFVFAALLFASYWLRYKELRVRPPSQTKVKSAARTRSNGCVPSAAGGRVVWDD